MFGVKRHEEAVYQSRAHSEFGYGIAEHEEGHFGGQSATMEFTKDDIRFAISKDGSSLYVYFLGLPDAHTELELFHVVGADSEKKIKNVSVLGSHSDLEWRSSSDKLFITTPDASAMDELATVVKVDFK